VTPEDVPRESGEWLLSIEFAGENAVRGTFHLFANAGFISDVMTRDGPIALESGFPQ
jgi:hypothetical protein